jgi:hypothetical protein
MDTIKQDPYRPLLQTLQHLNQQVHTLAQRYQTVVAQNQHIMQLTDAMTSNSVTHMDLVGPRHTTNNTTKIPDHVYSVD